MHTQLDIVYAETREDPVGAAAKYEGKRLVFPASIGDNDRRRWLGRVTGFNLLPPEGEKNRAHAELRKGAAAGYERVGAGQPITLSCSFDGWEGAPRFRDCTIAR